MMSKSPRVLFSGALKSPTDNNDLVYESIAQGPPDMYEKLPETYDLRAETGPIRDQGLRPTCVAFAGATVSKAVSKTGETMSPEFLYANRKNKSLGGMFARDVFAILNKIGSVFEKRKPYGDMMPITVDMLQDAAANRVQGYARINTISGLKRTLLETGPAIVILRCYGDHADFWKPIDAGHTWCSHAVTVVGYTKTGFLLQNSWGADWNGDGCTIIDYKDWWRVEECWGSI